MKTAFPAVAGNRALCERLATDILESKLSHAYIIEGAKGSAKGGASRENRKAYPCATDSGGSVL